MEQRKTAAASTTTTENNTGTKVVNISVSSKKNDENYYLKIPLALIRFFLINPRETEDVIRCSIYKEALRMGRRCGEQVYKSVIYEYYNQKKNECYAFLPSEITHKIDNLVYDEELEIDEERFGFDVNGVFSADQEADKLREYSEKDPSFDESCAMWYNVRSICYNLGLNFDNIDMIKRQYNKYIDYVDDDIYCMVSKQILTKFLELSKKSIIPEYERVQFAFYCGIKSIQQMKDYAIATKSLLLARMVGLRTPKEIDSLGRKEKSLIKGITDKYGKRWQFSKLLNAMIEYRYIKCCFGRKKHGYYISTRLNDEEVMNMVLDDERKKLSAKKRIQTTSTIFAKKLSELRYGKADK